MAVDRYEVKKLTSPTVASVNSYLIWNLDNRQAALIDPGRGAELIHDYVREFELQLTAILLTHLHTAHIVGVDLVRNWERMDVYAHRVEKGAAGASVLLDDECCLNPGGLRITVFWIPGHSPGHLCYLLGGHLFTGDSLLAGSVGSTADGEDHCRQIRQIRDKLFRLGDDIRVWPGHGPSTTIGIEKYFNPWFAV
ncbi:MAG: MBL fold metallo-hydrolase [Acidobacteria bacterium]|nr:MBL fold metallo-hydrolase [Acidobacteriota bacterium]